MVAMDAGERSEARKQWERARQAALDELAGAAAAISDHEQEITARRARFRTAVTECESFGVGIDKMTATANRVVSKNTIRRMLNR